MKLKRDRKKLFYANVMGNFDDRAYLMDDTNQDIMACITYQNYDLADVMIVTSFYTRTTSAVRKFRDREQRSRQVLRTYHTEISVEEVYYDEIRGTLPNTRR